MYEQEGPSSSAYVDIVTSDTVTWLDAFQFASATGPYGCGCTGVTGANWTLTGSFQWDIKANNWNAASPEPSLSLSSQGQPNSVIVVDDPINLVLNANVPAASMLGGPQVGATGPGLIPGEYQHALRMTQGSNVIELMHGKFKFVHGV